MASLTMLLVAPAASQSAPPVLPAAISGIHPHLAMFNDENECGIGAVVPWAGRLWAVTYAPHAPRGSTDKLYEIDPSLRQTIRSESIGGTPANRMIHRESQQLFLGPYVIDADGGVRVIPYSRMFGRLTANARHLTEPARKVYCATMEEGLYEIDVATLEVRELFADEQQKRGRHAELPGYHGKGLCSGQGRLVYANNGEHGGAALRNPRTPSGVLAEWDGESANWVVVRRSQFTEVTGPGGLLGNPDPANDPLWSIGWDHRSLLLLVRHAGRWRSFRLPKGSHSYDGAHGWNTEWPRIRAIGERDLLMTMHGLFWRFPAAFGAGSTAGIAPRSAYLKVIGDFCRFGDHVVFGCDDTARSEFLNKRRAKGAIAAPRSQSNLWFVAPDRLDAFGPPRGVGGWWCHEDVAAGVIGEPFLVAGFERRGLHLAHDGAEPVAVAIEIDDEGDGDWEVVETVELTARGYAWTRVPQRAVWVRVRANDAMRGAVAFLHLAARDARSNRPAAMFAGLSSIDSQRTTGGLVRARGGSRTSLVLAPFSVDESGTATVEPVAYELDVAATGNALELEPTREAGLRAHTLAHAAIPRGVFEVDAASVIFVEDGGRRWRLPRGPEAFDRESVLGPCRVVREVATERDLLHLHGTFYELPAENAGGFAFVRPVASHELLVHDFCSYRGLLVMTGVRASAAAGPHVVRSADGRAALWVGAIDDLWRLGKPRGHGGPWRQTAVAAGELSDPYLCTGYDERVLELAHDADHEVQFTLLADLCGDGQWTVVRRFAVPAGQPLRHEFPPAWSAYWLRLAVDTDCRATAQLEYR